MPQEVIEYLNQKADDEKAKRKRKIVWNDSLTIGLWRNNGVYRVDDEQIVANEEETTLIEANTPVFFDPIAHETDNEVV